MILKTSGHLENMSLVHPFSHDTVTHYFLLKQQSDCACVKIRAVNRQEIWEG
jgi:hypothetical protein